jgi:TrmH family RNA methyltransferase
LVDRSHSVLRRIRALRRDRDRLEAEGVVLAEGVHLVAEALRAGIPFEAVVVSPRLPSVPGGAALAQALGGSGVEPIVADDDEVRSVQDARSPQPVVAIARFAARALSDALPGRPGVPLVVVADGVQDPGNLGSLLRSADAAGATGFVATGPSARLRHPRTVRATMGSIFRIPAAGAEAGDVRSLLARLGIQPVGADPQRGALHDEFDWTGPVALVIGGEGAGIEGVWEEALASRVRIAMSAEVESLSVPAAGAVLLFEAARRRRRATEELRLRAPTSG